MAKFPFRTMDYSPWSSKNLIDQNRLKKFMQVGIDVKCMHTNFSGNGYFGFGDTATLKNSQISLSDIDFGGRSLSGFGDFAPFCLPSKLAKFPFRTMDYNRCTCSKSMYMH